MQNVFRATFPLLLLLAGCAQPTPDPHAPGTQVEDCFHRPRPQSDEAEVNGHWINTPDGGFMSAGTYSRFELSGDRSRLVHLNITMTWDAAVPTQEHLRFEISDETDVFPYQRFEGPSPLHGEFDVDDESPIEQVLTVYVGTVADNSPLPASATVVEQPVLIVLQETYRC